MKRGHSAILLAVILVAAVAMFVLFKGVSTTGMAADDLPQVRAGIVMQEPLPGYIFNPLCDRACTPGSNKCIGSCGICSPFTSTCVTSATYRMQVDVADQVRVEYQRCTQSCNHEYTECKNENPSSPPSKCFVKYNGCNDNCRREYYPVEG